MLGAKYIANGKAFVVEERDRVTVVQKDKQVLVGFSHSRPWRAALKEADSQ